MRITSSPDPELLPKGGLSNDGKSEGSHVLVGIDADRARGIARLLPRGDQPVHLSQGDLTHQLEICGGEGRIAERTVPLPLGTVGGRHDVLPKAIDDLVELHVFDEVAWPRHCHLFDVVGTASEHDHLLRQRQTHQVRVVLVHEPSGNVVDGLHCAGQKVVRGDEPHHKAEWIKELMRPGDVPQLPFAALVLYELQGHGGDQQQQPAQCSVAPIHAQSAQGSTNRAEPHDV